MAKITIKDIAQKSGFSKTAVSFAFNSPEKLPKVTVDKIMQVADELGYFPDPLARSLYNKKTGSIGLLIPQGISYIITNPFYQDFIEGIGKELESTGNSLLLVPPLKGSMTKAISNAVVDGFLTVGLETVHEGMKVLSNRKVPFVMIDSEPESGTPCVNIDDETGAYDAMKHLLELGHRDIAILTFLNPAEGDYTRYQGVVKRRLSGYREAMSQYGLSLEDDSIDLMECGISNEGGEIAFSKLFKKRRLPTAIITMSDILAKGVYSAAKKSGVIIPQELSVVGFDNSPVAKELSPPLTTVNQPTKEKGKLAAKVLWDKINNKEVEDLYSLETTFIIRESTAAPHR